MPTTQQSQDDVRAELEREEALDLADPLRHFLAIDDDEPSASSSTLPSTDIRDLPSETNYSLVPQQLESIIDRRTTIRYYSDLSRRPVLLDSPTTEEGGHWDVALKLDMTTGCGGKIWPAAEVLGAYIAAKYSSPSREGSFDWRHKRIIELGSGTGLVGYLVHALHLEGCQIWVTDQDVMLHLMRENLALNFQLSPTDTPSSTTTNDGFVKVAELDWGTELTFDKPDVLLLADCVYLESAFQPLIDTMTQLSTSDTEILFCYQKRRKADKRFFALLKRQFTFEDVKDDDSVRTEEYRRQGTQLLRIRKK
ncbi:Nicotinamide N-methyltransferase-like protein [Kalmanozyma brasiliensis GHG001]|uniref:Protein-lysine N-methyltransferase EFM6 n=1 Tax=Kalmanozyma brasiliensis (strain GHG001) TaxID=1365824 RepID=V5GR85_KALBG|nr:Nicotinamide N-methyltransferase-like protein [Kalmanozyma brasiliensis GHG001]EST08452.1 Nicotinamide N-methyltransferase-like protein [Kalmanozyma brasiliensis GHG001]